jgi:mannitol/fructose-specific phosphotransferase system IIA component (Ntr-type)
VRTDVAVDDAEGMLGAIAALLAAGQPGAGEAEIRTALRERERLGSTAVGGGCAIPHARLARFRDPVLVVARARGEIDFGAPDGRPVRLFFGLGVPATPPGSHLAILSAIARSLRRDELRRALVEAPDAAAICAVLEAA